MSAFTVMCVRKISPQNRAQPGWANTLSAGLGSGRQHHFTTDTSLRGPVGAVKVPTVNRSTSPPPSSSNSPS